MGKKNFVAGILDRKPMIILIMILVLIGGLVSYVMIPKQHFPKVIVPVAAVSVVYPGASAEELEELVAKPVEQKCMELNGYDNCTTNISENVSTTSVVLNMNLSQDEVDDAWDDLRLKMNALQSELPSGVSYIRVDDDIMAVAYCFDACNMHSGRILLFKAWLYRYEYCHDIYPGCIVDGSGYQGLCI